jgi:hypothetical protein
VRLNMKQMFPGRPKPRKRANQAEKDRLEQEH